MAKILLAVLLVGAIAGIALAAEIEDVKPRREQQRKPNFMETLIKYLPLAIPEKDGSTIAASNGDICDDWRNNGTIFDECDSYNTHLACYNGNCQCLDVVKVFEENYNDMEDEAKVWADAAIHIFRLMQVTFNTTWDGTVKQCTGNLNSVCPFMPFPTTDLKPEVKVIIDGLNKMKCTGALKCLQYSKTNDYVGFCGTPETSSSSVLSGLTKPVSFPSQLSTRKCGSRSMMSVPFAAAKENWDLCDESDELEACDSYNTYLGCYSNDYYGPSLCQCLGVEQMLQQIVWDAYDDEDGTTERVEAVRHLLKYANGTLETSYDSLEMQCRGSVGALCVVKDLPKEDLRKEVVDLLNSVSSFQCACGLECVQYSERNPYAGTCHAATKAGALAPSTFGFLFFAFLSVAARFL